MANQFNMPMTNSRDAPRFSPGASGFDSFFDDVTELATRANLSAADTIKWAIRYAGLEADSWRCVPCFAEGCETPATFAEFREEVLQCYPDLSSSRRYTHHDLQQLVDRTRNSTQMTRKDLGLYY